MTSDRVSAFRAEREAVLDYCRDLTAAEWSAPSLAKGWTNQDVVAHLAAGVRALLTPEAIKMMRAKQIERSNDVAVDVRRANPPAQVLDDYGVWSKRAASALTAFSAPGIGGVRLPVGELGWHPLRIFPGMFVFDWHTHLRHDIAPALDRPVPGTDDLRMTAITEWMLALLQHFARTTMGWLDQPIALTLDGPGGGTWRIEAGGPAPLTVVPGEAADAAVHIIARSLEFPVWSTTRRPWRECDVTIAGDADLGARFLDALNLV